MLQHFSPENEDPGLAERLRSAGLEKHNLADLAIASAIELDNEVLKWRRIALGLVQHIARGATIDVPIDTIESANQNDLLIEIGEGDLGDRVERYRIIPKSVSLKIYKKPV